MARPKNLGYVDINIGLNAKVQAILLAHNLDIETVTTTHAADVASVSAQLDTKIASLSSSFYGDLTSLSSSVSSSHNSDMDSIALSVTSEVSALSSSALISRSLLETSFQTGISVLSSSALDSRYDMFSTIQGNIAALSSSVSSSIALLSASIGASGHLHVNVDSELSFNGDTLLTDADIYISGSGNNLYLHGTNELGYPAKFEFSISSGSTTISEVAASDFGDSIDDPWFKFDGDALITHADIYVSGSGNYLYLNGTNEQGEYAKYYFDIVDGLVTIAQSGSA